VDTHIRDTETIERKIGQKRGRRELQETTIPSLKFELRETKRKADEMVREAGRIAHLEAQMAEMQEEFREMKAALHTGQTAYNFEKDLAAYIYPLGTYVRHGRIFSNLMNWLEANRNTPEGREGNRKWKDLKRQFGWSDYTHRAVFLKMVQCRQPYAHPHAPHVNYALPTSGNFSRIEARRVEDIRRMTVWLSEQYNP
jgi:hypothetical protein